MPGMEVAMRSALILAAVLGVVTPASAQVAGGGFFYGRLGYGAVVTENGGPATAIGFGFRGELDTVAVDFSFGNLILASDRNLIEDGALAGSMIRLQVLRFLNPETDRSLYVGGGMSYAAASSGRTRRDDTSYTTNWRGTGIQADLAAGYEFARSSSIRLFVQTDVGLPLFKARQLRYAATGSAIDFNAAPAIDKRYIPSAAVTFGLGWQRNRP